MKQNFKITAVTPGENGKIYMKGPGFLEAEISFSPDSPIDSLPVVAALNTYGFTPADVFAVQKGN